MSHQTETSLRRVLVLDTEGRRSEVVVEIGYPEQYEDDFACHVYIKGHSTLDFNNRIFGIDPLQAMTLAIRFVNSKIVDHPFYKSGELYWLEPGNEVDSL
jgi:hypothetical protein